jgi:chromosome segregation ATPase
VASFQRSLLGYRRRDVDVALAARDREIKALNDCLTGAEMELAEAVAALESRQRELARHAVRIAELDRTATLLAERVVERQRELRVERAELAKLQIHRGSTRGEASRSDRGSRDGGTAGAKPVTGGNGIPSPSREAGGAGVSDRQTG